MMGSVFMFKNLRKLQSLVHKLLKRILSALSTTDNIFDNIFKKSSRIRENHVINTQMKSSQWSCVASPRFRAVQTAL